MNNQIKHLNYTYESEIDVEEDNRKIFHSAKDQQGNETSIDYSPYERMNLETFQMLVELKFPARVGNCPLNRDSVIQMFIEYKKVK